MNSIKGIIFDYGGTIDTNGIHWAEVIWEEYCRNCIPLEKVLFREAYVYGERELALNPIIKPTDTFRTLLYKKIALQACFLHEKGISMSKEQADIIAEGCYKKVLETLEKNYSVVEKISKHYPLTLVTNFYGNISVVLKEFSLNKYFPRIVESSVVGLRKPDPALFAMGVETFGLHPEEVLVIGDSYRKDIYPARTLGCKAIWLKKVCWEEETIIKGAEPTAIIESLESLPSLLNL